MLPPQSPSFSPAVPYGALCPSHPATAASSTCERCGNFMCTACSEDARWTKCPGCREQEGTLQFPLDRNSWNFSNLWEHCGSLFKPQWLMFSLSALIALVISYVGAIPGSVAQIAMQAAGVEEYMAVLLALPISLLGYLLGLVMGMGQVRISLDVFEGRQVELGRLFSQFRRLPAMLGLTLAVILPIVALLLLVALGAVAVVGVNGGQAMGEMEALGVAAGLVGVLLVAPLVVLSLTYYLSLIGLVVQPEVGPIAQLTRTWAALRGQKLASLGLTVVLALVMVGGMMLCCVGYLPAYAFTLLVMTGLYLALNNEGGAAA